MPKVISPAPIPKEFICPITCDLMLAPVATADGYIYERKAIEEWLKHHDKSPLTNLKLAHKQLIGIPLIKNQIQEFIDKTRLCTEEEFLAAIVTGEPEAVEKLNYTQEHVSIPDALYLAVSEGHLAMVDYLLQQGANPNVGLFTNNWTPLLEAINKSKIEKVEYHNSPDHIAIAKLLLDKGANPDQQEYDEGDCPILIAASKGLTEIVKHLILHKVDLNAVCCLSYCTPLHFAAARGYSDTVELLLKEAPELIDYTDYEGNTPLHTAASNGHLAVVALLLAEGADHKSLNKAQKRPVQLALEADKKEIAEAIPVIRQAIKRTVLHETSKVAQLEKLLCQQQQEISRLKQQLHSVMLHLEHNEAKSKDSYTPTLF